MVFQVMADDWPTDDIITHDAEEQIRCKPLKERKKEKFETEENTDWRRRSVETPSEGSTLTTNESSSVISDADRERSYASSVISDKLDDQTFEGEEVSESDEEAYWNEILAAEAERALERAHIAHPTFFDDDSNRYGPNVTIISSSTSGSNEEFAIKAAAKTFQQLPADMMIMARIIKKQCEEKFGNPWHCIVADGNVGFYSRNDEHTHFTFKKTTVYMFRHQSYEPDDVRIRRLSNQDSAVMAIEIPDRVTVMANGMNREKREYALRLAIDAIATCGTDKDNSRIAERIVDRFEQVYGSHFHCAVTDANLGYHVLYDPDNIILFRIGDLTICLFKENFNEDDPFISVHPFHERKNSGVLVPLVTLRRNYVVKNGMHSQMLQFAVSIAQKAISEKYDGPYHCIVATQQFGFYVHYDEKYYARFVVDSHYVLIFRAKDIPAKDLRVTRYIPIGCAAPDIRVVSSGMTRPRERFAIDLVSEGIQRFVGDKMRAARHVVERFEERHGSPYHCAMSEGELGFSVHHRAAMHFKIGSTAVFLFRNI
ncbi:unnamed protein product [Toxocara canis]|uniref:RING-type domain-containing protein n=1 Tax=Toxocara canis TaxID=6265 RepID=A0A183UPF7_TOXCA|nr:unnamed protein product [Toxocara canis]